MKLVVFGLSVSSSWGNGHATLWRGLIEALSSWGHRVTFFERDVPYYAAHRDLGTLDPSKLILYGSWPEVQSQARAELAGADAAIVTSFCPDGAAASELVLDSTVPRKLFYDLDTPITLDRLHGGLEVPWLPTDGLAEFDLVLSFTGGRALTALEEELGARATAALHGSVDPRVHRPVAPVERYRGDLSYLGTYSLDRQAALDRLFVDVARRRPDRQLVIAGSLYPDDVDWPANARLVSHLAPEEHSAFYCSSPLTLSVTRAPMAAMGYCPSGRLFEAAACGVPVLSDSWEGLERFFEPGEEILVGDTTEAAIAAMELPPAELAEIGRRARERVFAEHTATHRAAELLALIETVPSVRRDSRPGVRPNLRPDLRPDSRSDAAARLEHGEPAGRE